MLVHKRSCSPPTMNEALDDSRHTARRTRLLPTPFVLPGLVSGFVRILKRKIPLVSFTADQGQLFLFTVNRCCFPNERFGFCIIGLDRIFHCRSEHQQYRLGRLVGEFFGYLVERGRFQLLSELIWLQITIQELTVLTRFQELDSSFEKGCENSGFQTARAGRNTLCNRMLARCFSRDWPLRPNGRGKSSSRRAAKG